MVFRTSKHSNQAAQHLESFTCGESVARFLHLVVFYSIVLAATSGFCQEQDPDFVDAFAPVDASAAAFHNEKFNEAERALLEGLSRNGDSSGGIDEERPTFRNVSTTSKARLNQAVAGTPERQANSQKPPVMEHTSLGEQPNRLARNAFKPAAAPVQNAEQPAHVRKMRTSNQLVESNQELQPPDLRVIQGTKTQSNIGKVSSSEISAPVKENDLEVANLKRELADVKSALAAAELEISRLSAMIQDASRARLSFGEISANSSAIPKKSLSQAAIVKQTAPSVAAVHPAPSAPVSEPSGDLQVATISVDKADLRLGPGRNHSALMSLRRGSRLAVEARQGEWYRVFAPNGQRAWIHSSLVRFGEGAASLNDNSSVKVRGYDSKLQ